MNYMTKPELLLHYTLIDEGVPLITDGIVLEINRKQVEEPILFAGFVNKTPVQFTEGLGTESGVDPLGALWDRFHEQKNHQWAVWRKKKSVFPIPVPKKAISTILQEQRS